MDRLTGKITKAESREGLRMRDAWEEAVNQEHDSAVERLEAALIDQDRLGNCLDAAVGTSTEFGAYVRLRAAGEQVAARQAWVSWVENASYRVSTRAVPND